ncbi:N-carbamoylsarcosine amidohydrolase [Aurantimonas sp. C2-6-R+9]|uniref:N-carbamoylsarcosine amidohydrolase n=1 Tax=unclassified Aurantimonas TaxID=2638230 RepID=UPI002E17BA7A|nr:MULTISPECIES: N-carbamoylsarcosine amidohydrolase [unclassified Aurantimonas]MEC5290625.1 N-carbamoylsarcosine amidohydrolase [Aurantimonas sp. C2-3-R2]MEC5380661.1 N-carbamoylsarcosine amidohydrolase [Aurantimonas sp. C2-6-R+9]MEC5411707.1 N-carbamoylsarcosine amidohydrolase [Aurantimonas sp. C2-4-R8]
MSELAENYTGVFDGSIGFGRRPVLVVIDFMRAYTEEGSPFFAQGVVEAVAASVELLTAARRSGIPVIHTRIEFHPSGMDGGLFVRKVPALRTLVAGEPLGEFDPQVAPCEDELVIVKNYASAFFGTSLQPTLSAQGVDTIVLAGCSTSGCIRATAIDGMQHGFRVIVPRECVGDRHSAPHEANLFDINAKYGDVTERDIVIARLGSLEGANVDSNFRFDPP